MQKKLEEQSVSFQFFDAIDGQDPSFEQHSLYHEKWRKFLHGSPMTNGEVACFASHYALWEYSVKNNTSIIVMEDDVELAANFNPVIENLNQQLITYQYIRLSALFSMPYKVLGYLKEQTLIRYLKGPRGAQAYAITPEAAQKFMRYAQRWTQPVDDYMDASYIHGVPCYGLFPSVAYENNDKSTIGNRRHKIPAYRKIVREIYRLYTQVRLKVFNIRVAIREQKPLKIQKR